jgi:hypothetical protein
VCIRVGHKAGPCTATFNDLLRLTDLIKVLIIPAFVTCDNGYSAITEFLDLGHHLVFLKNT